MLGARLLLVSRSPKIRQQVLRALNSTGCDVTHVEELLDARQVIRQSAPRIILVDVDCASPEVAAFLSWLVDAHTTLPVLLLSQQENKEGLIELLSRQNLNNLIAKHGAINASQEIDEHELIVTVQKLLRRDIFGLEKYISGWGIHIHTLEITNSRQKPQAVQELERFAVKVEAATQIVQAAALVADELITNAVFNAPRCPQGKAKYAHLPRNEALPLEPQETVTFRYGCDGRYLALSVIDNFGSLQRDTIVGYLRKCFSRGADQMDTKEGGAGLGIYMLFNSLTQLVFNIHYGRRTEVVATFYIRGGYRAFRTSGQSLNVFVTSDSGNVWVNADPPPVNGDILPPTVTALAPGAASPMAPRVGATGPGAAATVTVMRDAPGRVTLSLGGKLDACVALDARLAALRGEVTVDLRGVTGATPDGLAALTRSLSGLGSGARVTLSTCPPVVVEALNRAPALSVPVGSVLVPHRCARCDAEELVLVRLVGGRPALAPSPSCAACGQALAPAVDQQTFLGFLGRTAAG